MKKYIIVSEWLHRTWVVLDDEGKEVIKDEEPWVLDDSDMSQPNYVVLDITDGYDELEVFEDFKTALEYKQELETRDE